MTIRCLRLVQTRRGHTVDWWFISLRRLDAHLGDDSHSRRSSTSSRK
ncbi:hypothetical protein [Lentzea sp. HUAS12]|nr:hypothetical protein [Lentzea sp. HUAS12]USX54688.1 hypothetical protein ND450_11450 [Lentzea sp. HUAS12]